MDSEITASAQLDQEINRLFQNIFNFPFQSEPRLIAHEAATDVRAEVLTNFGVLSPLSNSFPITRELRRKLLEVVNDVLSSFGQEVDEESSGSLPSVERIQSALGIRNLYILERLGGLSGCPVNKIQYDDGHGTTKMGVIKQFPSESELRRELSAQDEFRTSWLGDYCPVQPLFDEEMAVMVAPFAVDPVEFEAKSLNDYLRENRRSSTEIIPEIWGQLYGNQYMECWQYSKNLTKNEIWENLLGLWPSANRAWNSPYYWHECGLPNLNEASVFVAGRLNWNPVYIASDPRQLSASRTTWLEFFQHGDLNTGNILLTDKTARAFKLIDFEKSRTGSAVLDLCWLSLSVMQSCCRYPARSDIELASLVDAYTDAVEGKESTHAMEKFELGLQFVRKLFINFREYGEGIKRERANVQIELTMGAASLAMAFYQVRNVKELLDKTLVKRPEDQAINLRERVVNLRMWAQAFVGIAAHYVSKHVDSPPTGAAIDLDTSWEADKELHGE